MSFSSQGHLETEEGGERRRHASFHLPHTCPGSRGYTSRQGARQEVTDKVLELRESTGPTDGRHPGEKVRQRAEWLS